MGEEVPAPTEECPHPFHDQRWSLSSSYLEQRSEEWLPEKSSVFDTLGINQNQMSQRQENGLSWRFRSYQHMMEVNEVIQREYAQLREGL